MNEFATELVEELAGEGEVTVEVITHTEQLVPTEEADFVEPIPVPEPTSALDAIAFSEQYSMPDLPNESLMLYIPGPEPPPPAPAARALTHDVKYANHIEAKVRTA